MFVLLVFPSTTYLLLNLAKFRPPTGTNKKSLLRKLAVPLPPWRFDIVILLHELEEGGRRPIL